MIFNRRHVVVTIANRQNPTENFRMQSLNATVKHFWKAGVVGNITDFDARLFQVPSSSTGAVNNNSGTLQSGGKIGQAHFVADADQGVANRYHFGSVRHDENFVQS